MELVRELSLSFADDGKRVKVIFATDAYAIAQPHPSLSSPSNKIMWLATWYQVCVQGSMGQGAFAGIPLQLAGTRKILEFMDWGDYGAKGTFINIGAVGVYVLPTYSILQTISIIKWNEAS
jgi:adenylate kinase